MHTQENLVWALYMFWAFEVKKSVFNFRFWRSSGSGQTVIIDFKKLKIKRFREKYGLIANFPFRNTDHTVSLYCQLPDNIVIFFQDSGPFHHN
jgi:hypothetical protein